jgi:hypothetical protein
MQNKFVFFPVKESADVLGVLFTERINRIALKLPDTQHSRQYHINKRDYFTNSTAVLHSAKHSV